MVPHICRFLADVGIFSRLSHTALAAPPRDGTSQMGYIKVSGRSDDPPCAPINRVACLSQALMTSYSDNR